MLCNRRVQNMYANKQATLKLYKETLKGVCQDYIIKFNKEQRHVENLIPVTYDVVQQLINDLRLHDKNVKARLVALVCYTREEKNEEMRVYHPSYQSEVIDNVKDFFTAHMMKIAQRMEEFNRRGSNLIIKSILEIHLHVTCYK